MMLLVAEHPAATGELVEAAEHYESLEAGLGNTFTAATNRAIEDILWQPDAWPKAPSWSGLPVVRSRKVNAFPYRVVYFVRGKKLVIVAYMHTGRRPRYWAHRIAASPTK